MQHIIENLPQYIYQRGAQIFSDLMWEIADKKPRIRQFVLTSSDYCKLYVTVLSLHTRRACTSVPMDCGEDFVYVPLSLGLISRTPYLTFPKIFLSHVYHSLVSFPGDSRAVLARSLGQLLHGVPVPRNPSSLSLWNLPALPRAHNQLLLYMGDSGMEGAAESRPVPSAFNRGFLEVDLIALFDVMSLDLILFALNAMLLEQKILLISSRWSSSFISHLCESLRVLMYPFDWQHVFIPLIPAVSFEDLAGSDQLPFWIGSALTTDHVHPLRFLEVPAPLLGGLKVKTRVPVHAILRQRFPDLNIVDLDNDVAFPAQDRVDRLSAPLPQFPRKLAQLIATRLSGLGDKLCVGGRPPANAEARARLERYARWDEVLPSEIFTGSTPSHLLHAASSTESLAATEQPVLLVDSFRRRSLVRTNTFHSISSQSRSRTWLGGFASFFKGTSPPRPGDDDLDSVGTQLIQAAVMEAFVKLFFAYRDFLLLDAPPALQRANSTLSGGSSVFVGLERHFQSSQFHKCVDRYTQIGSDAGPFVKAFLSTQCWDIFVRTTALYPVSHVFDTACGFYAISHKVDYMKFRQFIAAASTANGQLAAPAPQRVLDECEKMPPCPLGQKPKDHFFNQLVAFVDRRRQLDVSVYSDAARDGIGQGVRPEGVSGGDPHGKLTHSNGQSSMELVEVLDVLQTVTHVLRSDLPSLYPDANVEASTLATVFSARTFGHSDVVAFRDAFRRSTEGDDGSHLFLSVLNHLGTDVAVTPPLPFSSALESLARSAESAAEDDEVFSELPRAETDSVWSHLSRPILRKANSMLVDDRKLLGGIPKTALTVRVPQVPLFLLRSREAARSLRMIFTVAGRLDYHCPHCGCSSSLLDVLRHGGYRDAADDTGENRHVSVLCDNCEAAFYPQIWPAGDAGKDAVPARILKLVYLAADLTEFPVSQGTYLNLSLLLGLQVQIHTRGEGKGRVLRGVVGFTDLVSDYVAWVTRGDNEDTESLVGSPQALPALASPSRSESSDDALLASSSSDSDVPQTPTDRAKWRVRQYRKAQRAKEVRKQTEATQVQATTRPGLAVLTTSLAVVRINVDSEEDGVPRSTPTDGVSSAADSAMDSPPVPPSERRPMNAAPRRSAKSTPNKSEVDA